MRRKRETNLTHLACFPDSRRGVLIRSEQPVQVIPPVLPIAEGNRAVGRRNVTQHSDLAAVGPHTFIQTAALALQGLPGRDQRLHPVSPRGLCLQNQMPRTRTSGGFLGLSSKKLCFHLSRAKSPNKKVFSVAGMLTKVIPLAHVGCTCRTMPQHRIRSERVNRLAKR